MGARKLLRTSIILFFCLFLYLAPSFSQNPVDSNSKNNSDLAEIKVKKFEITGSTVLSQAELSAIVKPYEGRNLTHEELLTVSNRITQLYIERGFITSGVLVKPITDGIVEVTVIEGTLPTIEVEGTQTINPDYVRSRIQLGVTRPLNTDKLQNQLRLLSSELLFKNVSATLKAGEKLGESILIVHITEVDYATISTLIEQLKSGKNIKERLDALEALMKVGTPDAIAIPLGQLSAEVKDAIPRISAGLKDSDAGVRSSAALILGRIGAAAKATIPTLITNLKDSDANVRKYTVSAIGSIGVSLSDRVNTLSVIELQKEILNLEKALKVIQNQKTQFSTEDIAAVSLPLEVLKARRNHRLFVDKILKNPWIWSFTIYTTSLLGIFLLRPLWLIKIHDLLKPIRFKIPLLGTELSLGFLLFPKYHPRVLDAWVAAHVDSVREAFLEKDTVRARQVHIPIPVILNGNTIAQINSSLLRTKLDKRRFCLLIWGEGGIGKTSLALQIATWAMEDNIAERLGKYKMLPILIETELNDEVGESKNLLVEAIQGQLQDLTNRTNPISEELLERLLREQRILVIVDRFSEMSEATRKIIRPERPDFSINALVVVSRLEEKLSQVTKTTLRPLRIDGNRLSSFIEAYLTQQCKRDRFTDIEFFDACSRLSKIIGTGNVTALLAKLYTEQLIGAKESSAVSQIPDNIPDLMLAYLNELNRNITTEKLGDREIHRDTKALAWECLKQTYQPATLDREIAIAVLAGDDAEARLNYLENRLRLIQNIRPAQNKIRFTLDPLAEYLAALHLIDIYKKNESLWNNFLDRTETHSESIETTQGFWRALWECCRVKGTEMKVPNVVIEKLSNRVTVASNRPRS